MPLDDRFEIASPIHIGQIATAYPAVQRELQRKVLLKVIHPQLTRDAELVERFRREGQAAARLDHPNVVRIFDSGKTDDMLYLALEWIDGITLANAIAQGPMQQKDVLNVAKETLAGLSAVHQAGLVHRDIKPDNILIARDGRIKLADFSLAGFGHTKGLTKHSDIVGSPGYYAPEFFDGYPASPQSDLFSLGMVLYEAITGSNPYRTADPLLSIDLLRKRTLPTLSARTNIDSGLARLVDALVQRTPAQRPPSALEALKLIQQQPQIPISVEKQPPYLKGKLQVLSGILGIAAALVMIFLIVQFIKKPVENQPVLNSIDSHTNSTIAPSIANSKSDTIILPANIAIPNKNYEIAVKSAWVTILAAPWAEVRLNDNLLGLTPLSSLMLPAGRYELEFTHSTLPPVERTIELQPNATDTVFIDLRAEAAELSLTALPWGVLSVDGDSVGLLPREEPFFLKPGVHHISLMHPQLGFWQDSIELQKGEQLRLKVDLVSGTKVAP